MIYIENQFFVSSLAGSNVHNKIAVCIYERIKKAIMKGEKSLVVIVVPVHPDGTWQDSEAIR